MTDFEEKRDHSKNGRRSTDSMEIKASAQWIQWTIGILMTIFMAISGYNTWRINDVSKDIMMVRDAMASELFKTKEMMSKEYVTSREYKTLCDRLDKMDLRFDKMEGKIDLILVRQSSGTK